MRLATKCLLLTLAVSAAAFGAEKHTLDVRVIRITDGDTLVAIDSNRIEHNIRLIGIDAPEKNQAFGNRSRQSLANLASGKDVNIEWSKKDRYGRLIAYVRLGNTGPCEPPACQAGILEVNLAQVAGGFAWHDKEYERDQRPRDRTLYSRAEQAARAAKLGLWIDTQPVAPWDFRHGLTNGPVKKSRQGICHDPGMSSYGSVRNFASFPTLDACIASGGRLPRNASRQ